MSPGSIIAPAEGAAAPSAPPPGSHPFRIQKIGGFCPCALRTNRLHGQLHAQQRSAIVAELAGLKALVVATDFSECKNISRLLRQLGMRTEWTLSAKEALLRVKLAMEAQDPWYACIAERQLPDMDGVELTRQIRALSGTTAVILTANDWTEQEERARAAGATACCAKPLFLSDLRRALLTNTIRPEAASGALPGVREHAYFRGKRLLLVEDNELNREIAQEILSEYGFDIETAENGAAAVEKIVASAPGDCDLILMDIQMPVMNGYEATRAIRALENRALATIPIVAMTANAFDEDRKAAIESGMDGFLSKPIRIEEVIQLLRQTLGQ